MILKSCLPVVYGTTLNTSSVVLDSKSLEKPIH